jgi:hypothetical protein
MHLKRIKDVQRQANGIIEEGEEEEEEEEENTR